MRRMNGVPGQYQHAVGRAVRDFSSSRDRASKKVASEYLWSKLTVLSGKLMTFVFF